MTALLYSRYGNYPQEIEELVKSSGFEIVETNPEIVITYGGDGTLVGSERDYPGIPKLPLKNSHICTRCVPLTPEQTIHAFNEGRLKAEKFSKLTVTFNGQTWDALNDAVIRNSLVNVALRFQLFVNSKPLCPEYIGDGVVVATPFGSTGYFQSICHQELASSFGYTLNNVKPLPEKIFDSLPEDATITVKILRESGVLAVDNNPDLVPLTAGSEVTIKLSPNKATIYTLP